jgi:hypothetical protein
MTKARILALILAPLATTLAACHGDGTGPQDETLTLEEVAAVALAGDLMAGTLLFEEIGLVGARSGPQSVASEDKRAFERTRRCGDGLVTVWGEIERVRHGEGVVEYFIEGNRTRDDCTHVRGPFTIVIDTPEGKPDTLEAYRKRNNGQPIGPQTTTYAGEFDWQKWEGETLVREGHCDFELTSVRNPDSMKRSVTGTICGREVDWERDWKRGT